MKPNRTEALWADTRGNAWLLTNRKCSISISRDDGTLAGFILKKGREQIDIWRGQRGGISVYDELDEKEYSDRATEIASVSGRLDRRSPKRIVLSIKKRYRGAPFTLAQRIVMAADHVRLDVEVRKTSGRPRSIQVRFTFPFPMLPSRYLSEQYNQDEGFHPWTLWAPTFEAPYVKARQNDVRRQDFVYNLGAGRGGITVPIVSAYLPEVDIGYSLISPLEVYKPKLVFEVEREFGDEWYLAQEAAISAATYHLALRDRRPAKASIILVPHQGDWRPGLGWLCKNYKEYFIPTNRKIVQQEGVMLYAMPCWPEAKIKEWKKKMGLRWQEVRYEERFGDYIPEREPWTEDAWKSKEHPERELKNLTYKRMNDYLHVLHRNGIYGFAYFQVGGDIERNFCTENDFEEFVMERKDGRPWPGCSYPDGIRKTWLVNPVPNSRWEKHILGQAKGIFEKYPLMAGLFVDQLCYRFWDYGRDDGMTMVHNRPVYNNHLSYMAILRKLHAILKRRGKTAFGNGPTTVEVQRYIDGVMAECRLEFLGVQAYLAIRKPLVMLTTKISDFKWCLKYGAFPHVLPDGNRWPNRRKCEPEYVKAFRAYLPLFELMRGRQWVLTPHALTLPEGLDGNIFKTPNRDYLISLIPREPDFDSSNLTVKTRLSDAKEIRSIHFHGIEAKRRKPIKFCRKGRDIAIVLPPEIGIGVLVLKTGG